MARARAGDRGLRSTGETASGGEAAAAREEDGRKSPEAVGHRGSEVEREGGHERAKSAVGRVLVVFAGDGTAESTLPKALRARGCEVAAVDVALGGEDHNVLRAAVARRLLEETRAGRFTAVFAAPPCSSFS
eukprot:126312-Pleurochrysis_carterae.AAC.1